MKVEVRSDDPAELNGLLERELHAFNVAATGYTDALPVHARIENELGRTVAGVSGHTWGGCCEIVLLWVEEPRRARGLGASLVKAVEAEAARRGCSIVTVSTHSFQAPGFYERLGYAKLAALADYPRAHSKIHYFKRLSSDEVSVTRRSTVTGTRIRRHIRAPRPAVYALLLDPEAVVQWKVPSGMKCQVHAFDAREGGTFRISLTYETASGAGKTSANTDTYSGRFVELVPNERLVEVDEFETDDPDLRGEMTITITLADAGDGTELVAVHEGLPPGVAPADNELGWQMALANLARLVEKPR